jgi:putative nucleotidyltransferase with HDIG domain
MSFALDLTEGQPMGHALRSCLIGLRLGEALGLGIEDRRDLYYALLLKDTGCSSNSARVFELFGGDERAAKHDLKRVDWADYLKAARFAMTHAAPGASWLERARRIASLARGGQKLAAELVATRCERGADIVRRLGFGPRVIEAVRSLDEHWDGQGQPRGLKGHEIPLLARVLCLAQSMEVFLMVDGPRGALEMVRSRRGRWFDPALADAALRLEPELIGWHDLDERQLNEAVRDCEPGDAALLAGPGALDRLALGFAEVVDAKSPFTAQHSYRMSELSLRIAKRLGHPTLNLAMLRRAALLHDIGKLSVPNSILDKPGPLTPEEWNAVKLHPYYTLRILLHVRGFKQIAHVAACHHERLDGKGYFRGLTDHQIPLDAKILATADIYDALTAARPYRPAIPEDTALQMMEADRGTGLSPECLDALRAVLEADPDLRRAA